MSSLPETPAPALQMSYLDILHSPQDPGSQSAQTLSSNTTRSEAVHRSLGTLEPLDTPFPQRTTGTQSLPSDRPQPSHAVDSAIVSSPPVQMSSVAHSSEASKTPQIVEVPLSNHTSSPVVRSSPQVVEASPALRAVREREEDRIARIEQKRDQAQAIRDTPNDVLERQLERVKQAERAKRGLPPLPTKVIGMNDSIVWALQRRFDAQIMHVLSPALKLPNGEPDLRVSTLPTVPCQPEVIKSNTERVVASLIYKGIIFAREMRRIMLWTEYERPRTLKFCITYFSLWALGLLIPGILSFLILLILYPPSRVIFFPEAIPEPEIPVPAKTPAAGTSFLLSIPDPALYRDKLYLVQDYAIEAGKIGRRFANRVQDGGFTAAEEGNGVVGRKYDREESDRRKREEDNGLGQPDDTADERTHKRGQAAAETIKQLERQEAEWGDEQRDALASQIAKTVQDLLGQTADAVEVLQNALSPPVAFPQNHARHRLAAVLAPIVLVVPIIPASFWSYACGAIVGLLFFGQPLLLRGADLFVEYVPDWREKLHLRDSLFSGVPTNAQLTLHLLRINEKHHHPLSPPPDIPTDLDVKQQLDALYDGEESQPMSDAEAGVIVDEEESVELVGEETGSDDEESDGKVKGRFKTAMKRAAKRVIGAGETLGQTRKKVGTQVDHRLNHSRAKDDGTNSSFPCKWQGASGHFRLDVRPGETPTVAFYPSKTSADSPIVYHSLEDLVELKKIGVSAKRTVLAKVANIELEGKGLEMRFKNVRERKEDKFGFAPDVHEEDCEGRTVAIDQVHRRDELFARLISIPKSARWETL